MQDQALRVFVPITKIDEEQRLVYGVLAEEAVDKSGEIFDYESSKPNVAKWSDSFKSATAATGQEPSAGNLRVMHGGKAAGKFVSVEFDDATKTVPVCAKVVDDDEWAKTREGVYTGFSIGGGYAKRWKDEATGKVRYTASLAEGSLVDNPCMYGATFTAIKAEGAEELRKFHEGETATLIKLPSGTHDWAVTRSEIGAALVKRFTEGGDITDIAPELESMKWDELAEQLEKGLLAVVEGKLAKAAPPQSVDIPALLKAVDDHRERKGLTKSLYDVKSLADVVMSLASIIRWCEDDASWMGTPAPAGIDQLKAALSGLGSAFLAMAAEEVAELTGTAGTGDLAMSMTAAELKKVVTDSAGDAMKAALAPITEELAKVQSATKPEAILAAVKDGLAKTVGETVAEAVKPLAKAEDLAAIDARLKKIEDTPAPVGTPIDKVLGGGAGASGLVSRVSQAVEASIAKAAEMGTPKTVTDAMRIEAAIGLARVG